jgi:minor histocompatibility antigen H13
MFPIIGSCVLFGLYILFRLFSKEHVNLLLTAYFLIFGFIAFYQTVAPVFAKFSSFIPPGEAAYFSYRLPWEKGKSVPARDEN